MKCTTYLETHTSPIKWLFSEHEKYGTPWHKTHAYKNWEFEHIMPAAYSKIQHVIYMVGL